MNVIINGFFYPFLIDIVEKAFKDIDVNYCAYIYHELKISPMGKTDYISLKKIYLNADYQIDWNRIEPLDEKILLQMQNCEITALKMMDRNEYERDYSYGDRKRMYLIHLRFWNHLIKTKKINLFISANVPHEAFDYIILCLCNLYHIPVLFFHQVPQLDDAVLLFDDWKHFSSEIEDKYREILHSRSKNISLPKYYDAIFRERTADSPQLYWWMTPEFRRYTDRPIVIYLRAVMRSIKRGPQIFFEKVTTLMYWKNRLRKIIKRRMQLLKAKDFLNFYDKNTVKPDLNRKYIYFPLHYQPELSTSPLAGVYVDQILIVQMISYLLPKSVDLYIKEHPYQGYPGRDKQFFKDLLEMNQNVKLIPKKFDSVELIDHSLAVVTCTGTAGWESLLRLKPLLMFGYYYYQYAPGVFVIKNLEECRHALHMILEKKITIDRDQMKKYLKAISLVALEGIVDSDYVHHSHTSPEKRTENLACALNKKIKELKIE